MLKIDVLEACTSTTDALRRIYTVSTFRKLATTFEFLPLSPSKSNRIKCISCALTKRLRNAFPGNNRRLLSFIIMSGLAFGLFQSI